MKSVVKFFLPLLVLAACTGAPKYDGSTPSSLYTPPKSWEANPKVGYKVNMISGRPVEPVTTTNGKPVITGIPIPALKVETKPAHAGSDGEGEGSTFIISIPAN